jgi:phage terminase small subunit
MGRGLSLKQRRFLKTYLITGNGTEAALVAYATTDRDTARAIAAENLAKPSLRAVVAELLDAEGISNRKLQAIHAHYLALYQSPDPREKALGLKALDMAYRVTGAYRDERSEGDRIFDGWTLEELEDFVKTGEWPERARNR